ncbi:MAG: hypothetical protein LAC66_01655, partial [Methylotenera sp.]|nr:hypothetical protein [Methylotenera sp.]
MLELFRKILTCPYFYFIISLHFRKADMHASSKPSFVHSLAASCLGLAMLSLSILSSAAVSEEKVLNVYNWSDYLAPDTIPNFEKETGIKVR